MNCKYILKLNTGQKLDFENFQDAAFAAFEITNTSKNTVLFYSSKPDDIVESLKIYSDNLSKESNFISVSNIVNQKYGHEFPELIGVEKIIQDISMLLGTSIHTVLETLGLNSDKNKCYDKFRQQIEKIYNIYNAQSDEWKEIIKGKIPLLKHGKSLEEIIMGDNLTSGVISLLKNNIDLFKNIDKYHIITEFKFKESDLSPDFFAEYCHNEELGISGTIDAILIDKETGEIIVLDYKTHKHGIQNNIIPNYTKLQLNYYKFILSKILNIPHNKINIGVIDINQINDTLDINHKPIIYNSTFQINDVTQIQRYINSPLFIRQDLQRQSIESENVIKKLFPNRIEKSHEIDSLQQLIELKTKRGQFLNCYSRDNKSIVGITGQFIKLRNNNTNAIEEIPIDLFLQQETQSRKEAKKSYIEYITEILDQSFETPEEAIEQLVNLSHNNKQAELKLILNLKKYLIGNKWRYQPFPALEEYGCILMFDTINQEYDVVYIHTIDDASIKPKMTLGNTIFGDIISDIELEQKGINSNNLLDNTLENIELMKIMLLLNQFAKLENNNIFKVNNIISINLQNGNRNLPKDMQVFQKMLKYYKLINKDFEINENIVFSSYIESTQKYIYDLMKFNNLLFSEKDFEQLESVDQIIEKLQEIKKEINSKYNQQIQHEQGSSIWELDKQLGLLITLYQNIDYTIINKADEHGLRLGNLFKTTYDALRYGKIAKTNAAGYTLSGLAQGSVTALAFNNPDNMVHQFEFLIGGAIMNVRKQLELQGAELNNVIKKLLKDKSNINKMLIGNNIDLYKMFFRISDGKIDQRMQLLNPYLKSDLDNLKYYDINFGVEFLETVLWTINKFRIPEGNKEHQLPENIKELTLKQLKEKPEYYSRYKKIVNSDSKYLDFPLRRTRNLKILKSRFNSAENIKEFWDMLSDGLLKDLNPMNLTDTEIKKRKDSVELYEMYDRYSDSESSRYDLLEKYTTDYFDFNISAVVFDYVFSKVRKNIYDQVLQKADYIIGTLTYLQATTGQDFSETIKVLKDRIEIALFSGNKVPDSMLGVAKGASGLKQIGAFLKMGFRPLLFLKEMSVGLTKLEAKVSLGYFNDGQIKLNHFNKALAKILGISIKDGIDKFTGYVDVGDFNMIGALNKRYGIANLDINITAEKTQYDRQGFSNTTKRLPYTLLTAPDFVNRMSIFVSQLIADGCYDAYSLNEDNVLVYDMSKDERFKEFWANKTGTTEKIKEQRALYKAMAMQFREQGIYLKTGENGEWDALPDAYTNKQQRSINEQINTVLATFDHELSENSRHMLHYTLFRQFNSYLSSEIKKYFATGHNAATGQMEDLKREIERDGVIVKEQLYIVGYDEFTHQPILKVESELTEEEKQTCDKLKGWVNHPVEGLLISFLKVTHDIFTGNLKKYKKQNRENNFEYRQRLRNTYVFLFNTLINMIIGFIISLFFSKDKTEKMSERDAYIMNLGSKLLTKYASEFSAFESIYGPISDMDFVALGLLEDLTSDIFYVNGLMNYDSSKNNISLLEYARQNAENFTAIKDFTNLE